MKIIVCIKQVPDTTEVRLDPTTGTLIREGVPSIINPDDKSGLEAALRLKDEIGAEVTVLTMGPPQAEKVLREALAMGADKAILLSDRAFAGADTWATSSTLAAAIRKLDYDLIIAGRQAIDGDTAQVGPQIAEHLGLPQVSYVADLKLDNDRLILKRMFEDGYHLIRVKMPCLITTLSEMNTPRYMSVGGVFDAFREKEIIRWTLKDIDIDPSNIGLKGSPTKVKKSFTKGAKAAGKVYDVEPKEAAQIIVEKLKEKFFI
ncbi:electron transfer flavoprotein subunit beta [Caloranaerobacter azorensis H53214]|uniref:Electron transfer flavoprotein small subunit n=1 Tax=Caloranaerobacter azorensis H53214 TaxID=1156417 RepID=A0A096BH06_9FIRM|nr:electron transfer flavoprotein subunit beta/FixA family protein [Caloranaerobacter azorensis]KGG80470.1 electron transfer flavoprotein subunit beta [Caloranaerobacter azorensis H53214]